MPSVPSASASQLLIFAALIATLAAYCLLVLFDAKANPLDTIETVMLLEAGALAGVSAPRK